MGHVTVQMKSNELEHDAFSNTHYTLHRMARHTRETKQMFSVF